MSSPTTPRKRGGPQPGSGRPEKPPEEKFRRAQITMTPEHFTATAKDRSGMVRRALGVKCKVENREAFCLWYYAQPQPLSADKILQYFNYTTP